MSNAEDDVDAFLYGDVAPTGDTTKNPEPKDTGADEKAEEAEAPVSTQTGGGSDDDDDGDDSSSDEDEDIEVILEPGNVETAGAQAASEAADGTAGGEKADGQDSKEKGDLQSMLAENAERMDILSVPLLNGLDMFTIDIDMLDEKPWRQPGADITDYFNFGFSEEAWKLYCVKQQDLRTKFNMNKMMPHMMMMQMGNPGMYPNMYPPGMMPQHMRPGQQGPSSAGDPGASKDDDGSGKDGDEAMKHMTPQQIQYQQQQQQMRMGMQQGFFPPGMRGMPMNQQQMANLPPQVQMQMQMQMQQMGGRPPMPQNAQGAHQRPGPNANYMGRGSPQVQNQNPHNADHRDNDRGSESGRSSRRHASRERSSSRQPQRGWEKERSKSRSRTDRDKDRDRDRGHRRDSSRADRDKAAAADGRRSSDRRRERSDRGHGRDRDRDRSDRSATKRRRSVSKEQEPKSTSRRRH
ncbi:cleavage polyadenylation factor subunit fip1 [Coemansia erecta]|nr:cleavage polyadenylation factor subunit fip1 [Coemansia erecta]